MHNEVISGYQTVYTRTFRTWQNIHVLSESSELLYIRIIASEIYTNWITFFHLPNNDFIQTNGTSLTSKWPSHSVNWVHCFCYQFFSFSYNLWWSCYFNFCLSIVVFFPCYLSILHQSVKHTLIILSILIIYHTITISYLCLFHFITFTESKSSILCNKIKDILSHHKSHLYPCSTVVL